MTYLNQQKKYSWPIRLALKLGAKNVHQANITVLIISIILLAIAIINYSKSLSTEVTLPDLTPEEILLIGEDY